MCKIDSNGGKLIILAPWPIMLVVKSKERPRANIPAVSPLARICGYFLFVRNARREIENKTNDKIVLASTTIPNLVVITSKIPAEMACA